ncbi:MAG TPA: hypothetical protein VK711_10690 [Puia sp.]|nr:hypothetical protein [Puia sp.]
MPASFLTGKRILVISPQAWGNMLISKHHYALELARRGNQVYFLNPPDNNHWNLKGADKRIEIRVSNADPNLWLVDQVLYFPYIFKFHARNIYNLLIKKQIRNILEVIGKPVDIVWSFDLGNLFPLAYFKNDIYKVFQPVDEPGDGQAILAARGADIIFSVTQEILDKYENYKVTRSFINHGLADEFTDVKNDEGSGSERVQAGMSGNLLRTDLDRSTLLKIVQENSDVDFHFFGSHKAEESNISGKADGETEDFLRQLHSFAHVNMHGVLKTKALALYLNKMDILLICYDIDKDQSRGTNYHKVMEYLSTGKVIVSNNISTYKNEPELVRMAQNRMNNDELPALFRETVLNLKSFNRPELVEKRKQFAMKNTYKKQLDMINLEIESDRVQHS